MYFFGNYIAIKWVRIISATVLEIQNFNFYIKYIIYCYYDSKENYMNLTVT